MFRLFDGQKVRKWQFKPPGGLPKIHYLFPKNTDFTPFICLFTGAKIKITKAKGLSDGFGNIVRFLVYSD